MAAHGGDCLSYKEVLSRRNARSLARLASYLARQDVRVEPTMSPADEEVDQTIMSESEAFNADPFGASPTPLLTAY